MKKIYLLLIASILLGLPCNKISAQAPYKASVGGMISPIPLAMSVGGFSFKTFVTNKITFQTDIYFKTMLTGGIKEGYALYSSCVINPNFMYQKKMKEMKNSELFWFTGGGISLGSTMIGNAKFGANAIMGIEYIFLNKPFSIQFDIRPGYGMLFSFSKELKDYRLHPNKNPWSHFDWLIGFTLRYTFKKKNDN
jgi:hypothetical protein